MSRVHSIGMLLVLVGTHSVAYGQAAPITIDGRFDDWLGSTGFTDAAESISGIDLLSFQVTNDEDYLFLRFEMDQEVDLLDELVPQSIQLCIDADNDPNTGNFVQTGYGCELRVRFDLRNAYFNPGTPVTLGLNDILLTPLPTITGSSFEMRIPRNIVPNGSDPLFTSSIIRILFQEFVGGDEMPNVGSVFSYTFDNTPMPGVPIVDLPKVQNDHVRVSFYNVENDGINVSARQDEFQRILQATAPDIIGFSECAGTSTNVVKNLLDTWLPNGVAGWYVIKDDYDLITASRWPFLNSWPGLSRQFPVLIDLPATYAHDLLVTNAHLNCCAADATRQDQVDEYAAFILDAKVPGGQIDLPPNTPFVYGGDLNLVGYAQQLTTLLTGDIIDNATYGPDGALDWDNSELTDMIARRTDERSAITWENLNGSYPPGRLDYIIVSDDALAVEKAFALHTPGMSPARLGQYGLQAADTDVASDHIPVFADLIIPGEQVKLALRVFLEGPYDPNNGLMLDSLRHLPDFPLQEPYTTLGHTQVGGGDETLDPSLLLVDGGDAVVDWVRVELRSATDPTVVIATQQALLQRDGDVMNANGSSELSFEVTGAPYHVVVRHRNHLGVMTANTFILASTAVMIDLTNGTSPTYGTEALKDLGTVDGLWTGNARLDAQIKYTGNLNDRDAILMAIGGNVPTQTINGYSQEDLNLDGLVRYTGGNNDRDPILVNIGGSVPTQVRDEQVP